MKCIKRYRAQSLIEFALLLPLLMFLVVGLFDIGRAVFYYSVLNTAAREGARFAVVQPVCDYQVDPLQCKGGDKDTEYPLICTNALSTANINICNEIEGYYYNIGDLSDSIVTINHIMYPMADPTAPPDYTISISIVFQYEPITPGLGLLGDFPINVNSEMLRTPLARPFKTPTPKTIP